MSRRLRGEDETVRKEDEVKTTRTRLPQLFFPRMFDFPLSAPLFDRWFDDEPVPVEEWREDGTVVVRAELPGLDPDKDVHIDVTDGVLTIRAERREENKEEKEHYFRSELRYGSFIRRIPLPADVAVGDVKAVYKDGMLEVRFPVKEVPEAKVPITRG